MSGLKIAVMVHNLRLPFEESLKFTADMGCTGVHLSVSAEHGPHLDAEGRRKLLRTVKSYGLEFSAISCWGGEVDLGNLEGVQAHVETGKKMLEFVADMECGIWQGHCGIMPHERRDPRWQRFADAFGQICQHGEKLGSRLAIETGPEPPGILLEMINDVGSDALCVNYDPANLIIWPAYYMSKAGQPYDRQKAFGEYKPMEGVKILGRHIVHTHAKDAMVFPEGEREVALGDGWVDWPAYVQSFRDMGYSGYFAIEREVGANPCEDIAKAIRYLQTL